MFNKLSRRQVLQVIGSFIAAIAGAGVFNKLTSILPQFSRQTKNVLYTKGRHLYSPAGEKIILRGINLAVLDNWDFPPSNKLAELEKTGANAVRIMWHKDYGQPSRPAYSIKDLDNILTECKVSQMIPIVCLCDLTCQSDTTLLNTKLIPWWTSAPVVAVLKKHQQYLIINLANELGFYRWTSNLKYSLNRFKNAYKEAITSIRRHLDVPIMIDAPDCGTSIEVFTMIGQELIDHDPQHNVLLSTHSYWALYNGIPYIEVAIKANLPLVFGEVANKQDEIIDGKTVYCYYDLDGTKENHAAKSGFKYQTLLQILQEKEIGWLAWNWWKDKCANRQISQNGNFSKLTPYGNDLVNNPNYGLNATAKRASVFDINP